MKSTRLSCDMLMNLKYSRQILEKASNIKLIKIHPLEAELFHAEGRTDRHDEANSCFSKF